jgi:DNA-binding CsgD family transcriptional regulator
VRVAIVSRSQIVRAGLVALIGELGERAIVVDTMSQEGRPVSFDVAIFDLDAADQLSLGDELTHLAAVGAPVIGLVYSPGNSSPPRLGSVPVITLAVDSAQLWSVLRSLNASPTTTRAPGGRTRSLPDGLTPRELDVLRLIASGASNKDIATQLYVSLNSVKTYIRTGYRKTGVTNRSSAVLWGIQHGLIPNADEPRSTGLGSEDVVSREPDSPSPSLAKGF